MSSMNKVTVDVHPFSGQQVLYQLYIIIQKSLIDQGGSHCLHVHIGLCPVCVSQLGHQNSNNI